MISRLVSFATLLLALSVPAIAQETDNLPSEVRASMAEARKTCDEPSKFESGFVTRRDVNGDGVPDYILDLGKFTCGDNSSYFCGSGGCSVEVFASLANGRFVKALDELVQDIKFQTVKGRPAVLLSLQGSVCGKANAQTCRRTLFWNGKTFAR